MFDRLIELITNFGMWFVPWRVLAEYERGLVLTYGRYKGRELEPGFHWIWPFGIDEVHRDRISARPEDLTWQVLTTKDDVRVQISAAIRWRIANIVRYMLEVDDPDNVISDITYGEIARAVRASCLNEINKEEWIDGVFKKVRRRAFRYGVEVEELQITDLSKTNVIRLLN